MKLGAVILAAGFSSRMGEFKPLLEVGKETMLARTIRLMHNSGVHKIAVVSGHNHKVVEREAKRLGAERVHNQRPQEGMFSSIKLGVDAMCGVDGFFVLPCDIPLIREATLRTLCSSFAREPALLFPEFNGICGHPPLIPSSLRKSILAAKENGGLSAELQRHKGKKLAVWDSFILFDTDTQKKLAELRRRAERYDILTAKEAEILASLQMPAKGIAHGQLVADIAFALAKGLDKGYKTLKRSCKNKKIRKIKFDYELLYGSALLHDICKGLPHHEHTGEELLCSFGLTRMAEIVGAHRSLPPPKTGILREKELVCLADKLASGKRRVDLRQRFSEKLHSYRKDREACRHIRRRMQEAEGLRSLWERNSGMKLERWLKEEGLGK